MKKSSQTKTKPNKRTVIMACLGLAVVLLLVSVVAYNTGQHNDSLRFAEANKKKQAAFNQLLEKIGMPIAREEKNLCYNSEQGPYDQGVLWCRTASVAYYADEKYPEQEVDAFMQRIIQVNSWTETHQRAAEVEFEGAKGIPCTLETKSGRFASDPGYRFTPDSRAQFAVMMVCADRAKAKHYPYTD